MIIAAMMAALLVGCVYRSMGTYDGVSAGYPSESARLAHMAASEMSRRYPAGHTALVLSAVPGKFAVEFEDALRGRGFTVRQPGSPANVGDIGVSYTLDTVGDEPACYLRVSMSDGESFGFTGMLRPEPASPVPSLPLTAGGADRPDLGRPLPDLRTPGDPQPAYLPPPYKVHTRGTAAAIAARNRVPVAEFCRWNRVNGEAVLERGEPVYLRAPQPSAPGAGTVPASAPFTVPAPAFVDRSGTAAEIAARNRVPVAEFCRWNGVTPNMVLDKGERIFLQDTHVSAVISGFVPPMVEPSRSEPASSPAAVPLPDAVPVSLPGAVPAVLQAPQVAEPLDGSGPVGVPVVSGKPSPAVAVPFVEQWKIAPGSLRSQIAEWCATAGYTLVWQAETDYEMESYAGFRGGFEEGVNQLFGSLQRAGFPLRITIYKGNQTLEVAEN
jgi:LysM repeat protein